ncbi:MAG: metallophosphoesterase [Acidobacteria bacterium]|nr:MAG: metallophosphoesterase [Acidobacteriota bacterium]
MGRHTFFLVFVCLFFVSQIFWIVQIGKLGTKLITHKALRRWLGPIGTGIYISMLAYNVLSARSVSATSLTLKIALLQAPVQWWAFGSVAGFILALPFVLTNFLWDRVQWLSQKAGPVADPDPSFSLARRKFLFNGAIAAGAVPLAGAGYGFLFGRIEFEKSFVRLELSRLPKEFHGFRIAQLSDIHIGPFMPSTDIRRVVEMTNELNPDLIVLTGDYVTWDPDTQGAAVDSLTGLKAPFGIYGCLGNHEIMTHTQASITRLFAEQNIRILRYEHASIQVGKESLNLIGVDYETRHHKEYLGGNQVRQYLAGVDELMMPGHVNILLSHNPNTFDRAAELGIDLSLSGHTHGGQISLDFISPDLSIARLMTPYVKGHFEKPGGQLYVNRGIGTIAVPIRFEAPPEITLFELVRA